MGEKDTKSFSWGIYGQSSLQSMMELCGQLACTASTPVTFSFYDLPWLLRLVVKASEHIYENWKVENRKHLIVYPGDYKYDDSFAGVYKRKKLSLMYPGLCTPATMYMSLGYINPGGAATCQSSCRSSQKCAAFWVLLYLPIKTGSSYSVLSVLVFRYSF